MGSEPRILVADDDSVVVDLLQAILEREGWRTRAAMDGVACLDMAQDELPDLVILDIVMPKADGFEVLRLLREWSSVPVIMLSGLGETAGVVKCLDLGADDYVKKPFLPDELVARIKSVLRRSGTVGHTPAESSLSDTDLSIDFVMREVIIGGRKVRLTPTECSLLRELVTNKGKTLTYKQLLKRVWGPEYDQEKEYVHVVVNRLRAKLDRGPMGTKHITTVLGVGYAWEGIE